MSSTTIRHLRKCFNYGEKQCGWCRYGAPTTGAIKSHIANHHPSKTAYFYDRMVPLSSPGIKFVGTLEETLGMPDDKLTLRQFLTPTHRHFLAVAGANEESLRNEIGLKMFLTASGEQLDE
ncbi:CLUMA_CG003558, isoform A [Clunio marinus]|uniref:CLUMA_CG003558, isoform A n=1 Tax=Clunio marinus TaxID=568069 RepID=A0A1J1HNZ1_9DIPT|nr:CLUMA_CG003558, isoform A [Clunio marinus]